MTTLDLGSSQAPAHAVARRLDTDTIGWFTTVRPDGRLHAVPVWFLWLDGVAVIMSEPSAVKLRNLQHSPSALLHLHADATGDGIVILGGTAVRSERTSTQWLEQIRDPYLEKYADGIAALGTEIDAMASRFSTVIEFTPSSLTAW
ncbi:pyridoxamine 5'-phosphate oxidase family protein [Nostocoides vanveenii]|uniref:Pyridoxamine 5'-phosphate oxidase family protein n=1 Tax=Nostocoides vanveenii TaxID=330835 RepID=A0ABN2L4Y9_9MICO